MSFDFELDEAPSEEEVKFTDDQIEAYNEQQVGHLDFKPLNLVMRDEDGKVIAGLVGLTGWEWLYIKILWVKEDLRGQGLGRRLMERAESLAIERGCRGACLSSFDFQAPEFYRRYGYEVCGKIDEYPRGSALNFLAKKLDDPSD